MKIMTYNIAHCYDFEQKKIDYSSVANVIKQCAPDFVGLNEVRDKGENFEYENQPEILSELTGLKYHYFAKAIEFDGNPYGNAFLSKHTIAETETIPVPDPDPKTGDAYYETRCVLKVKLENGLTVMVAHFGLNKDEQENAVATVLDNMPDEKCVLMGDFNVKPNSEILKPLYEVMKDAASSIGNMGTFPSHTPDRKLDYIFVTPDIEVVSAEIPIFLTSDHRPHTAEIKL